MFPEGASISISGINKSRAKAGRISQIRTLNVQGTGESDTVSGPASSMVNEEVGLGGTGRRVGMSEVIGATNDASISGTNVVCTEVGIPESWQIVISPESLRKKMSRRNVLVPSVAFMYAHRTPLDLTLLQLMDPWKWETSMPWTVARATVITEDRKINSFIMVNPRYDVELEIWKGTTGSYIDARYSNQERQINRQKVSFSWQLW